MRNYEGLAAMGLIANPSSDPDGKLIRRSFFIIDRYLRLLDAAGIPAGQPRATGAMGQGPGGGPPCCPNEVDEFEIVNDTTEGILAFGRALGAVADEPLGSGHSITRIEGGELNTLFNLNGDIVSGAVTLVTTPVHTGTYAIQIVKAGGVQANFSLATHFDGDGQPATTVLLGATVWSWRAWIRFSALPDASRPIITLRSGATVRSQLSLSNTGALSLDGVAGVSTLTANTWYELTGVYDSASTGTHSIRIKLDGATTRTQEFSNVTPTANGTLTNIMFGTTATAGTYTMIVDDIMIEAGASTSVVDYPPPGGVYAIPLSADGAIADVWGLTGAATRWEACTAPHSSGSFIAVTGTGDRNQSFFQTIQAGVPLTIHCAQFNNIVSSSTAGNYTTILKIGQTNAVPAGSLTSLLTGNVGGATATQLLGSLQQLSNFTGDPWNHLELETMVVVAHAAPTVGGQTVSVFTLVTQVATGEDVERDFARAIRVTDEDGHVIPAYLIQDGTTFSPTEDWARLVAGHDGTNVQILLTDSSGRLMIGGPGSGASDLGKAEDAIHVSGDVGVMALAVRADTAAASAANGDYIPIIVDGTGRQWVNTELNDAAQITTDGRTAPTTAEIYAALQAKDSGASTISRISSELANANNDGDTSDRGVHVSDVVKYFLVQLTALNITYDDSPTSASSATVDCSRFRKFIFGWQVFRTNSPTDIQVTVEFSNDGGTTWFIYRNDFWGQLIYDDIEVGTTPGIRRSYMGDCLGDVMRVSITCTGTSGGGGGATFTVDDAFLILKN